MTFGQLVPTKVLLTDLEVVGDVHSIHGDDMCAKAVVALNKNRSSLGDGKSLHEVSERFGESKSDVLDVLLLP